MIGIPYARPNHDGTRTCPVCGIDVREKHDRAGEQTTNVYGAHYQAAHSPDATDAQRAAEYRRLCAEIDASR